MELFVYLAYHKGGNAIPRFQPELEKIARAAGARYMRFSSTRRGMLRIGPSAGYLPHSIEYVKELADGH